MDKAILSYTGRLMSRNPLTGLGAPVSAHIVEAGGGIGDKGAKQHSHAIQRVVFRGKGCGGLGAVPVEGGGHYSLGEVRVGQPVGPLALALEAACNGVLAKSFLVPAQFVKFGIAEEYIPDDYRHLGDELPVFIRGDDLGLSYNIRQVLAFVQVKALGTVFLYPAKGLCILLMVVYLKGNAAQDFGHIHPLGPDAEIFLEHIRVAVAARDAHCHAAQVDIGFILHPAHSHSAPGEFQYLFSYVGRDGAIPQVLHIVAVDGEGRQAFLGVGSHDGGKVHRSRALGAVKAPYRLDGLGVHIKGL